MTNLAAAQLGLEQRHLEIVAGLLEQYVPNRPVWAFGSRTFGRARRYSDLDLAVGGTSPLVTGVRLDLMDAFDRSLLPIEVDVVDLNDVEESFRSRIQPDFIEMQSATQEQGEARV